MKLKLLLLEHKNKISIFMALFLLVLFLIYFYREIQNVQSFKINSWTEDHTADCALVLTGGPHRIREGLDLLTRKSVQKLVISGVHPTVDMRELFPLWPVYGNLNEHDVILERRSTTTYGNAHQSLPLIQALQCRSIILITSNLHMYRAIKTFKAEFPKQILLVARAVQTSSLEPSVSDIVIEALKSQFYSLWAY